MLRAAQTLYLHAFALIKTTSASTRTMKLKRGVRRMGNIYTNLARPLPGNSPPGTSERSASVEGATSPCPTMSAAGAIGGAWGGH